MKIIKQGVLPSERMYRGTCIHCKAEVEFKQGEATSGGQRDEGWYVKCPTEKCGGTIWGKEL